MAEVGPAAAGILGWKVVRPGAGKNQKPRVLNTATIARLSRKLIAREWARAMGRGKGRFAGRLAQFEGQAAEYHQKKERRKKLEARARRRAARLIHSLQESLSAFARSLCELPPEERAACAEELLRESLCSVADMDHIHWSPGGCEITFEPWAERRLRRKNPGSLPVLFRVSVDEELRLTGCVPIEHEEYEVSRRESIVDRILAALRRHGRTPGALEDALWQVGRVVGTISTSGGMKLCVQPWEEVRRRNARRGGRPPLNSYVISADAALEDIRCEPC
ncbi:MAG: hypothetical protein KAX19_08105 [Candidatus Brocadiae bacterium]|nr:hypothetical protein [Candidatus Brocadiia bacterium]